MSPRIPFALAAAVAVAATAPPAATAQSTFEGVVTFQMGNGPLGPQTMRYSVKGKKLRMDISAQGMDFYELYDAATQTQDMVIPMRRMYTERKVDAAAVVDSTVGKGKVKWTGKKETIAGHECEHADITVADGSTADLCLARDLGAFLWLQRGPGGRGGPGMGGWQDQIGQTFPLKVMRDGKVVLLATHVEKKALADSVFAVPAGYQKMGMPGRGGGR
ncbi:MAG: DUF4412 domain-containing protein [Gemmatimonadetes bacterium]|nr:DUF4412 domain-containing protein [Gemmatimonadota bacterium]